MVDMDVVISATLSLGVAAGVLILLINRFGSFSNGRLGESRPPADRPAPTSPPAPTGAPSPSTVSDPGDALDRLRIWVEAQPGRERPRRHGAGELPSADGPGSRVLRRTLRLARRGLRTNGPDALGGQPAIRALGFMRVDGFEPGLTSQQESLLAVLGLRGPRSREQLIEDIWAGRAISDSRFANLLAEVRAVIGRDRLQQDAAGRYALSGIVTDVARFSDLVGRVEPATVADRYDAAVVDAELERLELALGLIEGPVLDGRHRRYWAWIDDAYPVRYQIEQMVVATGLRAAALALAAHQPQRARWACERCLLAVPNDEQLVATLAGIHLAQGRHRPAAELVAGWEQAVRKLGLGEPSCNLRTMLVEKRANNALP